LSSYPEAFTEEEFIDCCHKKPDLFFSALISASNEIKQKIFSYIHKNTVGNWDGSVDGFFDFNGASEDTATVLSLAITRHLQIEQPMAAIKHFVEKQDLMSSIYNAEDVYASSMLHYHGIEECLKHAHSDTAKMVLIATFGSAEVMKHAELSTKVKRYALGNDLDL